VKKWLIDIRPDPKSKWAQTFAERLAALALITPLAVDEDPTEDADLNEDDESKNPEPASTLSPAPQETPAESVTLASAPVGDPEQTVDPLRPKASNDYSHYWMLVVPKMAEANKDIPGQTLKELAKAAMNESGNDVLKAYDLLRQKIGAAKG
jgi:hypothetical protein